MQYMLDKFSIHCHIQLGNSGSQFVDHNPFGVKQTFQQSP